MKTIYFRTYIAVLASLILSNLIAYAINDSRWRELKSLDVIKQTQGIEKLILRDLESSGAGLDNFISDWYEDFGYALSIVPFDSVELDDDRKRKLVNQKPVAIVTHQGWRTQYVVYRPLGDSHKILHISWLDSSSPEYDNLTILNLTIPLFIIAIVVFFVVKPIRNNINYLVKITESYAVGNFEQKVNVLPEPFNHLALTLSNMAKRLTQVIDEQNKLSSSITHELRTPLARLRLALDLTRNIHVESELRDHIQEMDNDIDDLEKLIAELLSYAHFSSEVSEANLEELDLSILLTDLAKKIEPLSANTKISACVASDHTSLLADPFMLRQAVTNLLVNAQRYARSVIKINVYKTPTTVELWIEDDGPGIPNELKQTIFKPFYRYVRDEHDRGYGLGLAIVNKIMEKHAGEVLVTNSVLGGANFMLRFPIATQK